MGNHGPAAIWVFPSSGTLFHQDGVYGLVWQGSISSSKVISTGLAPGNNLPL